MIYGLNSVIMRTTLRWTPVQFKFNLDMKWFNWEEKEEREESVAKGRRVWRSFVEWWNLRTLQWTPEKKRNSDWKIRKSQEQSCVLCSNYNSRALQLIVRAWNVFLSGSFLLWNLLTKVLNR